MHWLNDNSPLRTTIEQQNASPLAHRSGKPAGLTSPSLPSRSVSSEISMLRLPLPAIPMNLRCGGAGEVAEQEAYTRLVPDQRARPCALVLS